MVKKLTWVVALLILAALVGAAQQTPRPGQNELIADIVVTWHELSPEGAGFSVLMPGEPSLKQNPVSHPNGAKTVNHSYSAERDGEAFMVIYADFPQAIRDAATIRLILDSGRDEALTQSKATLQSESELTLDGFTGREFVMKLPDGLVGTVRVFWGTNRLFQQIIVHSDDQPSPALQAKKDRRAKFIKSFSLRKWHESQ